MYYKQKISKYLLLTFNVGVFTFFLGFILPNLLLIQKVYFKILKGLKGLVWRVLFRKLDRFLSYLRKRTFNRNDHSMSFAFTRCHSLSLVVIRCTTRCSLLYHSLSFVVVRCIARLLFCKQSFSGYNLPVTSILKQLLESILESAWNYKNKREHGIEVD